MTAPASGGSRADGPGQLSRRGLAAILAFVLLVLTWIVVVVLPVPYVIFQPGPTFNLLQRAGKDYVVEVHGARTYRDGGALRMLTVIPSAPEERITLVRAVASWLNSDDAVYRYSDIYSPDESTSTVQEQGNAEMTMSQDAAITAAMRLLGKNPPGSVQVVSIVQGGPAYRRLQPRDEIRSVDGRRVRALPDVTRMIGEKPAGTWLRLGIVRGGRPMTVRLRTTKSSTPGRRSALLVSVATLHTFPFRVSLAIDPNVGGPSAGMMFALAIYDTLTPGSLTGGGAVAGTGTTDDRGRIGPIGGVEQKIAGAREAGAQLFLAPAGDCDEVASGSVDPGTMRVTRVATIDQAMHAVKAWRANHHAPLPECR